MTEKMRPLWSKEACSRCGDEGYATRTQSRPKSDRYVCEECEIWEQAENEFTEATIELQKDRARIDWLTSLDSVFGFVHDGENPVLHILHNKTGQLDIRTLLDKAMVKDIKGEIDE